VSGGDNDDERKDEGICGDEVADLDLLTNFLLAFFGEGD
jgi:hypothetical protein